jgi:hypothetical protein
MGRDGGCAWIAQGEWVRKAVRRRHSLLMLSLRLRLRVSSGLLLLYLLLSSEL